MSKEKKTNTEKKTSKETKTKTKEDKIKKLVNRYIEELDEEISDEVKIITTGSQKVYCFNDRCERDRRDNLHMRMLLSATLRKILNPNNDDDDDNNDDDDDDNDDDYNDDNDADSSDYSVSKKEDKNADKLCKKIKKALEYAQSEDDEYPEYIQKFFLKNE